jgi:putative nucleotidyltransferase with HDIG domain
MRLFRTILLLMLFASAAPTLLVGFMLVSTSRKQLISDSMELAAERLERIQVQVIAALGSATTEIENTARKAAQGEGSAASRQALLRELLSHRPDLDIVGIWDGSGEPVVTPERRPGVGSAQFADHRASVLASFAQSPNRSDPQRVDRFWSPGHLAPARGGAAVTLVVPIPNASPTTPPRLRLAAEISLDTLQSLMAAARVGPRGVAFAVDRTGRIVAHSDPGRVLVDGQELASMAELQLALAGNYAMAGTAELKDPQGRPLIAAYTAVPDLGLGLVAGQPREDALASLNRMSHTSLVAGILSFCLTVVLSAWFARSITRPVGECVRGALDIARGRFGRQLDVKVRNEIGELAYTFNHMSRELRSYDSENQRLIAALEAGYLDTIRSLAGAIDAKDPYTQGHNQRVAELAAEIGRELRLGDHELKMISYGGLLHDVGKIGVPEEVLRKKTPLTDEEKAIVREHPVIGAEIVRGVAFLAEAEPAIRSHHERWDGRGYPEGLAGEAIPLVARIVNAADTWDACTSTRPYQAAMRFEQVVAIMETLRGNQIDPSVCDALLAVVHRRGDRAVAHPPEQASGAA